MTRYMRIKNWNISNGAGIGVSVYFSGCHFHCKGCFNEETWDPAAGKPYTDETEAHVLDLLGDGNIDHLSILGGEPLDPWNIDAVRRLMQDAKRKYPGKKIWLWTGYEKENLSLDQKNVTAFADYVTYGHFDLSKRNIRRKYSGSNNQFTVKSDGTIIEDSVPSQKGKNNI